MELIADLTQRRNKTANRGPQKALSGVFHIAGKGMYIQ